MEKLVPQELRAPSSEEAAPISHAAMQNTTNTASQPGQNDPTSVFEALGAEPDIAVGIVRSDGHILHANDTGVKMYFDRPASDVIGKNYLDIFPKELAQERLPRSRR